MAFASLVLTCAASAQEDFVDTSSRTRDSFDDRIVRHYGSDEGLPSNWVNDLVQTRDGFVWIGTDNGLVRYDGASFELITSAETQQSPQSEIHVLYEGQDGTLWIGTSAGLARYTHGYPSRLDWVLEIPDKQVFAIAEDQANSLWVGTEAETYAKRGDSAFRVVENAPTNVRAICQTRAGTMWIGSHHGLFRRSGSHYEQITHERLPATTSPDSSIPQTRVNTILETDDGDLWIGTYRTLLHIHDGQFTSRGSELGSQQIYQVLQTRDKSLYIAARFGLFRVEGESACEEVSDIVSAFCLMEHRNGGLWVGHGDNRGLMEYRERPAQTVWQESPVHFVCDGSESDLWFGSRSGLHRIRDGEIETFDADDSLSGVQVQALAHRKGGGLWVATSKGLGKWTGKRIVSLPTPEILSEWNISVVFEDSNESVWLALGNSGGYLLRDGQLTELSPLAGRRTHWFWEAPDGVIWIGHEAGLFQYRSGQIQQAGGPEIDRLLRPRFLCHHAEPSGSLWIGTSNGILRYRAGHYDAFPPDCGLLADNIERLAADGAGNLWFGGRDGLFYTRIEELDGFAAGRLSRVTSYRVPGFDRFPPIPAFSQGCIVKENHLWLVSEFGLVTLPVETFRGNPPLPTIQIEHVDVDGVPTNFGKPFSIQSGSRRISIDYSVLAFENRNHLQVAYRLDGHDDQWVDSAGKWFAQYTDLRPGDYRFRAMTRHGNGPWTEVAHSVSFEVVPRWWELRWLRAVTAIVLIAGAFGYSRHRLQNARRANNELRREITGRMLAQEQARQHQAQLARVSRVASIGEVSTSIAHEIKQPLFAIVSNAQTAGRLLDQRHPDIDEVRDALTDIANDGNRASAIIDRIRAMAKKERQAVDELDINRVVADAAAFAEPEIAQRGLQLKLELAGDLPHVCGDAIELQQVVLNLLVNGVQAMEEAESRELVVRTTLESHSVQVAVCDHGRGVDEDSLKQIFEPFVTTKPGGTGLGLAISRTIVEAHGGRIWAERNEDTGMTFFFQIPIPKDRFVLPAAGETPTMGADPWQST